MSHDHSQRSLVADTGSGPGHSHARAPDPVGRLLAPAEVAERLGVSERTLAAWRNREYGVVGPRWVQVSQSTIRYLEADVDRWVLAHRAG